MRKKTFFLGSLKGKPYLCNVFFIVLDLRLTRLGYSGISFFCPFREKRCDIRSFYPFLRTFLLRDNHSNLEKIIIQYHICEKIAPNFRRTFGELRKSL